MKQLKINFTGEVLPRGYDIFAPAELVDAGVILPATSVMKAFDSLSRGDVANVYVSSPGGDCFMGAEIVIAARKAMERGVSVNVEVGAIAASMAANLVAAVRASGGLVRAHANSQLMFHSAFTQAAGGAQAMEDRAALVRNTNASVITDLAALGITDCRAWFAEGREKWISAKDALTYGLVAEIADDPAVNLTESLEVKSRLAAFYKEAKMNEKNSAVVAADAAVETAEITPAPVAESEPQAADPAVPAEGTPAEPPAKPVDGGCDGGACEEPDAEKTDVATAPETPAPADPVAMANERFAKLQASHDKMISNLKSERDAALSDLATAKAEATSLKAEIDSLKADLAKLGDQLTSERAAHEAVVAKALRPAQPVYASNRSRIASGMKLV